MSDFTLKVSNREIQYSIKKSKRAKHARITVLSSSQISITIPFRGHIFNIEKILKDKQDWILAALEKMSKISLVKGNDIDFKKNKRMALKTIKEKVIFFNQVYNFSINKISVRNQGSRWGSCSSRGNLNFNYRLLYLTAPLIDYVIVHEICHLGEMNHSKKFWALVAKALPDYKKRRFELRKKFKII